MTLKFVLHLDDLRVDLTTFFEVPITINVEEIRDDVVGAGSEFDKDEKKICYHKEVVYEELADQQDVVFETARHASLRYVRWES